MRLIDAYRRALHDGDRDTIPTLFDDDFVSIDHRHLGMGTRDKAAYVESVRNGRNTLIYARSYEAIDDTLALALFHVDAGDRATWDFRAVVAERDGRFVRLEEFDADDAAGARNRYDELTR